MKWKCRLIALFPDRKCDKNCHVTCNLIAKSSAVRFLEFIKACLKKYNSVLIINTLQWVSRTTFGFGRAYWPKRPKTYPHWGQSTSLWLQRRHNKWPSGHWKIGGTSAVSRHTGHSRVFNNSLIFASVYKDILN